MIKCDYKKDSFRMFLIDELACKACQDGKDVIRLTLGKTDFPLQINIRERIIRAINDQEISNLVYPSGIPELREELVNHYVKTIGIKIPCNNILIDAGTSSIYRNLLQIILDYGDEILLPRPYYPLYKISAQLANANIQYYEIDLKSLEIDTQSIKSSISNRTKAIILNSPGNPLGNVISLKKLSEIKDILPKDIFVIFDEIYENTYFNGEPLLTKYLLNNQRLKKANVIITNSFSKAYRMYTKRIGWCILPDNISTKMLEILQHTRLTVDPSIQYGALEALSHTNDIIQLKEEHNNRWLYTRSRLSCSGLKKLDRNLVTLKFLSNEKVKTNI
jgi:aspartate/methionine/tyrosine aminotransferase